MGELTYSTPEIQARLTKVNEIGTLSSLNTTAKSDLVAAVNELFTSASEGKAGAIAALAAQGITIPANATWAQISQAMTTWASGKNQQVTTLQNQVNTLQGQVSSLQTQVSNLQTQIANMVEPLITNGTSVTPTGTYATSTYYNTTFGVRVSYTKGGDVVVTMKGGTSTSYENLIYTLTTSISGVSLAYGADTTWAADVAAGRLYSCVITGLTASKKASMAIKMSSQNSTNDTVTCAITLTAA